MDKSKKDERTALPESPASVTARVVSDKGFRLLFTLRDTTGTGLLAKFEEFQNAIVSKGWKPEEIPGRNGTVKRNSS